MKPIHILLIEDNEGDILLTRKAFEDAKTLISLSVAKDGMEVLDFLNKQGKYTAEVMPNMLLPDINLPIKNGRRYCAISKKRNLSSTFL